MVGYFEEDIPYLDSWLEKVNSLLDRVVNEAKEKNVPVYFSISTTKKNKRNRPYLTPVRHVEHGILFGVVVYSQIQALIAGKAVDGKVEIILIDAEKKIDIQFKNDNQVADHFGIDLSGENNFAYVGVELGNLSAACKKYIQESRVVEYKPNDLTVEAVWHILIQKLPLLSGKKVAIIGCGNIGFKLALKLVESGTNVDFVRRDFQRGLLMANLINEIKPATTLAKAYYQKDSYKASLFADVIIGASSGNAVIDRPMVQAMKKGGFLIDVGKGSFEEDSISYAIENEISIYRCDVTSAIYGYLSAVRQAEFMMRNRMGRQEIAEGVFTVSGGFLGKKGDIIVDNFKNPSSIIGVADGRGDFVKDITEKSLDNINKLKSIMEKL